MKIKELSKELGVDIRKIEGWKDLYRDGAFDRLLTAIIAGSAPDDIKGSLQRVTEEANLRRFE